MTEPPRVRVRGIYATALAKALLSNGIELSDLSRKLKERLKYEGSGLPPHTTVKQSEDDVDEIVAIGFPKETDKVIEVLKSVFPHSVHHVAVPNLHSAYKVMLDQNCKTVVDGVEAKVRASECYEGKTVVAEVVRSKVKPHDEVIMEEGFRIIGFYAEVIVGRGPGVSFSRHITDPKTRAFLTNLSSEAIRRGVKVHWRSSAKSAPPEELLKELEALYDKASKVMLLAREAEVGAQLYEGERLDVIYVPFEDKVKMDELRSSVLPTMPYHHSLKSGGDKMAAAVELGDKIAAFTEVHPRSVIEYVMEVAKDSKFMDIVHRKVDGTRIVLGKGKVKGILEDYIVLERRSKSFGVYDGLGEIKEPGDVILTLVKPFSKRVIHFYYDKYGTWKGGYVNINTGVEVGEGTIKYLDLEIDVVCKEECFKVDVEEARALPQRLRELAMEEVEKALAEADRIRKLAVEARRVLEV